MTRKYTFRKPKHECLGKFSERFPSEGKNRKHIRKRILCRGEFILNWEKLKEGEKLIGKRLN